MTRIQGAIAKDASDAFWAAIKKAIELDDLPGFKAAVRKVRQTSPVAAIAIADVIEADEEPENAAPVIKWLIAALRGDVVAMLH